MPAEGANNQVKTHRFLSNVQSDAFSAEADAEAAGLHLQGAGCYEAHLAELAEGGCDAVEAAEEEAAEGREQGGQSRAATGG